MGLLLVLIIILAVTLCIASRYFLNYWTRYGIPQMSPEMIFGDFKSAFLHKESFADASQKIFLENKHHGIFGVYVSYRPMLFINDPLIVKDIMVKDSTIFQDRGYHSDITYDVLSEQLFFQRSPKWKEIRVKLTPAFTSNKLKQMLPIATKNLEILEKFMTQQIESGKNTFEFRDLISRLNTNIISAVAFGMDVDTIDKADHIMRKMGAKVFEPSMISGLRLFLSMFLPKVKMFFKIKFVNDEIENFFSTIIKDNIIKRETGDYQRSDLLQTMIDMKNRDTESHALADKDVFTVDDICAQAFGFYLAGFETTSTTVSYCLYELSKNPELQARAQQEIDENLKTSSDASELYSMIKNLKFVEACVLETLRKYPPLPLLSRECSSDYQVANSEVVIEKGTSVIIPIFALQRDPEIYENPLKFNPDRFLKYPNSGSPAPGSYFLPMGEGQRICIGHRMGKQNATYELAALLAKFNFSPAEYSKGELTFNPKQLFLQPKENFFLKVSLRNK